MMLNPNVAGIFHTTTILVLLLFLTVTTLAAPQLMIDTKPPPAPPADGNDPICEKQKFCGRVYFERSTVDFDQAMCMEIRGDWKSVWVANCQCTFWKACTPGQSIWNSSPRDIFLDSMSTCEKERTVGSFAVKPKFISCSYKNAL